MNYYTLSEVNQVQNPKKRKKIITNKEIINQNPVKVIKPTITKINSINNNFTNSNLNFLKNKDDYEEEFEIIEPSLQNTIKKSNEKIPISNNTHLSNRNLNSINTGFTSTADSKSLNYYQNVNEGSLSEQENKMKIIKKPNKISGLSARELMDIVDRRKKILGLETNYSNNSINNLKDKSSDIQTSLYYHNYNYFNDVSNSIEDNNFINMSFSQINTLKLSNIKNKSFKRKLPINPSKDIVNCIFDDNENEKDNMIYNSENINNNIIENNIFEIEKKDETSNNTNSKIEESIFNIEKNSDDEEEEVKFNEFKIELNDDRSIDKNSKDKSVILNISISSPVKLSISSSSSSLNKEEVTQFDELTEVKENIQNETKDIIDINFSLFNNNNKKDDTITKQKINFFEETLNKIPKKICKDQINNNLLKLLPPSPNISGNKNIIKFTKNKYCKEIIKEEKHVRQMKSFDINKDRKIDFQHSDYCILKTSSLEKKSNRSYSKSSRNKKLRQVGNYSDYYKNKISEIVDIKRFNKGKKINTNKNKKHIILKVNSKN